MTYNVFNGTLSLYTTTQDVRFYSKNGITRGLYAQKCGMWFESCGVAICCGTVAVVNFSCRVSDIIVFHC